MQTIERTALSELIANEDYARKVLPHMRGDYFSDRSERIVFEEIQKFVEKYNSLPNKTSIEIEIDNRRDLNEQDVKAVIDIIKSEIENNDVCLFMKGTPDAPQCGFSMATSNILKVLEVNFKGVNVLANQKLREGIKVFSDWPTIPQLYVKNEFIGGCDIVKEMYESGELAKLFESKGINFKAKD